MITLIFICVAVYVSYLFYIFFGLFRHTIKQEVATKKKTVSVVIASRNEQENLPGLLSDLINQDYPQEKLEIIVVDDRSNDNTENIVKKHMVKHNNIKYTTTFIPILAFLFLIPYLILLLFFLSSFLLSFLLFVVVRIRLNLFENLVQFCVDFVHDWK